MDDHIREHLLKKLKEQQILLQTEIEQKSQVCNSLHLEISNLYPSVLKDLLTKRLAECTEHLCALKMHNEQLSDEINGLRRVNSDIS